MTAMGGLSGTPDSRLSGDPVQPRPAAVHVLRHLASSSPREPSIQRQLADIPWHSELGQSDLMGDVPDLQ